MTSLSGMEEGEGARRGGSASATAHALAVSFLLAATAFAALPPVFRVSPSPDELSWGRRSLVPWWFPEPRIMDKTLWSADYRQKYTQCIHHPTLARIVYRTVLTAAGYDKPPEAVWKYGASYNENIDRGNYLPLKMRRALRLTNAAFFAATVLVVYFGALRVLASPILAVLAVLPIVVEPTMRVGYKAVVPYAGADALFIFLLVFFWYVWLFVKDRPLAAVVWLGLVGGLAVSTKVNGLFVLAAAMVYYAVFARGWLRLAVPSGILALAAAVFLALDPVYFGGGFQWGWMVFRDTVALMFRLKEVTTDTSWGSFTKMETLAGAFPYLPFIVPAAAAVWRARSAQWFAVTFAWAVSIVVCNLALIYMPQPRYAAPARVAFFILVMAAGLSLWRGERESPAAVADSPGDPGRPAGGRH